ncbi:MAG: hypothetical protein IEMM0007_0265 [bacterium]|nr:MAG: hypothetical protein IEMM0007_0265 [bacterium]
MIYWISFYRFRIKNNDFFFDRINWIYWISFF